MWEWIREELMIAMKSKKIPKEFEIGSDKEDIVQEICLELYKYPQYAEKIYEEKNTMLIYGILKRQICRKTALKFFHNVVYFTAFKYVTQCCEEFNIEAIPENAYKISVLMEYAYNKKESIATVVMVLKSYKQCLDRCSIDELCDDDFENMYTGKGR